MALCRQSTVTKNGDGLGDLLNLVEFVADEDGGNATFLEVVDHTEEVVNLFTSQRRGGLVHEQELDALVHRTGDSNQLLGRHGDRLHRRIEVDVDTNEVKRAGGNVPVFLGVTEALAFQHRS